MRICFVFSKNTCILEPNVMKFWGIIFHIVFPAIIKKLSIVEMLSNWPLFKHIGYNSIAKKENYF